MTGSVEPRSVEPVSLRLVSNRQITFLLSSIWAQAISPQNTPANYEAIVHTYSLILLFSRPKSELSSIEKQLLSDFLPDDICPLRAQFVEQIPCKNDGNCQDEAMLVIILGEDDLFIEAVDSAADQSALASADRSNLLIVNQLLETVLETAWQVGRMPVSTATDVPFMETTQSLRGSSYGETTGDIGFRKLAAKTGNCS